MPLNPNLRPGQRTDTRTDATVQPGVRPGVRPGVEGDNQLQIRDDRPAVSDVDRILAEEWDAAARDREARRQEQAKGQSDASQHVDQIAAEEVARRNAEAERRRQEELARKRHVDRLATEEVAAAARDREAQRQASAQEAASLMASQAASNARIDERTDQAMQELYGDLDAQASARRRANELQQASQAASNARIDERTDQAMNELMGELDAQASARQRASELQAASDARIDQRANQAMQELYDELDDRAAAQESMRRYIDQIAEEEVREAESGREGARQREKAEADARLAAQAASDARIDELADRAMRELSEELDAKKALSDKLERIAKNELFRNRLAQMLWMNPGIGLAEAAARVLGIDRNVSSREDIDDRQSTRDVFDNYVTYTNERIAEQQKERSEREDAERKSRIRESLDREAINDEPTHEWTDITGAKSASDRIDRIVEAADERHSREYESVRNRDVMDEGSAPDASVDDIAKYMRENSSEPMFIRAINAAQNMMMKRFLNPYSLRIEGMRVETKERKEHGKKRTYGRIVYSERVTRAIGMVRRVYNCSEYNVLQLVQLRAGLGVGIDGTIANIDPDKFELTEDQFWELCSDIIESQARNGNPLGPVNGIPGASGVRDETGRFVVVAGTRCFPLGYMPRQLIRDLSADPNSPLYIQTEQQVQTAVGNQWINQTYPQLLANTGGNLMFQARAIENMMRGIMAIDGMNPADLDIPEAQYNRTLMTMRTEQEAIKDPALRRANEVKHQRLEREVSRWYHRMRKSGGARDGGARVTSAKDRRRNGLGDAARGLGTMGKMAKAANVFLWISSPIEAAQAMAEQKAADGISNFFLYNGSHQAEMRDFQFTDRLDDAARSKDAIEALDVANSLYRIGGHSALTAFIETLDSADGRRKYSMTNADLRRFLQDSGVIGATTVTDKIRQVFGVKPGQEKAFLANAQGIMAGVENTLLGTSSLFKESESRQFVKMSMAEMGRSRIRLLRNQSGTGNREFYNSSEVEEWANVSGEEMIRSLLQTDAGREAFMTQGVTSLARKSPVNHLVRRVMTKNGITELAVRTMFDRFPEYGIAKLERQVPFSNTISYLASYGISSSGDMLAMSARDVDNKTAATVGDEMSRVRDYQMGGRQDFFEGLRKNLLYDSVMGLSKLGLAALYKGIIEMLGGIHRPEPPEEDDRYNWSEWLIGKGEDAMPIKWAWWMDDFSGIAFPLGTAWAIAKQGDYSPDAVADAANVFINAVANLNSGNAIFDAIDLVKEFDRNADDALGKDVEAEDPGCLERLRTSIEIACWDFFGDMTPTIVGQIVPWSKDSLFRQDDDGHTGSYVYDTDKYTLEEAIEGNHTKYVEDYHDREVRNALRYNPLGGLFMDLLTGADKKGASYRYTKMPIDTMADDLYKASWDEFYLDLSTNNPDVPTDLDEKKKFVYEYAEHALQEITSRYSNPTQASASGLVLNADARAALKAYCNHMIYDVLPDQKDNEIDEAYLKYGRGNIPDDEWERIGDFYDKQYEYYQTIRDDWLGKDSPIPWSIPRYARQESDWETRYVDADQNPSNFLNYAIPQGSRAALRNTIQSITGGLLGDEYGKALSGIISDEQASPQQYYYGNVPTALPFSSPRTEDKAYNYETPALWAIRDENGDLVTDLQDVYDRMGNMVVQSGRNRGSQMRELYYAGQGTNAGYQVDEDGNPVLDENGMLIPTEPDEKLNLGPEDVPTVGSSTDGRVWRAMEERIPDSIKKIMEGDKDTLSAVLGFEVSTKDSNENTKKDDEAADSESDGTGNRRPSGNRSYNGSRYYGGTRYYRSSYSGGGGGGYASSYNPRIYSSPHSVYSQHASGMSVRQPYKATSTYLRPGFYTSGSRKSYRRQN
jgi:hypothetical protein